VRSTGDYGFQFDLISRCSEMMLSIRRLPQPVIAKVQAIATAAGCQLVAACDLAVASSEARFATPGVNIGLFCGTPSVPLGRNVGSKRALEMLFTGEPIDAATALRDGLVSRVVAPAELDKATMELATTIASKSPLVLAQGKALFHKHMEMDLEQAYAYATTYMAGAVSREDAKLGIDAFVNKRGLPEWTGR
jgi:enoyl-CoA hydratase/carnithine racemase